MIIKKYGITINIKKVILVDLRRHSIQDTKEEKEVRRDRSDWRSVFQTTLIGIQRKPSSSNNSSSVYDEIIYGLYGLTIKGLADGSRSIVPSWFISNIE